MLDVRTLVQTGVINGIRNPRDVRDPKVMITAARRFVSAAYEQHAQVVPTTITHYGTYIRWAPQGERCRLAVNASIRTGDLDDEILDSDRVLADSAQPKRLRAAYDSGNHCHAAAAGRPAMAGFAIKEFRTQ